VLLKRIRGECPTVDECKQLYDAKDQAQDLLLSAIMAAKELAGPADYYVRQVRGKNPGEWAEALGARLAALRAEINRDGDNLALADEGRQLQPWLDDLHEEQRHLRTIDVATLTQPSAPPDGGSGAGPDLFDDSMLSCGDLSKVHHLGAKGKSALQQRLKRWRFEHGGGWQETPNPGKNTPTFLYRYGDVKRLCEAVSTSQQRHSGTKSSR
jgi:hypothetical protein